MIHSVFLTFFLSILAGRGQCELVHLRRFDSRRAAQADLFTYIEAFYNTIRPHSSLGWLPPRDFEKRLLDWKAA